MALMMVTIAASISSIYKDVPPAMNVRTTFPNLSGGNIDESQELAMLDIQAKFTAKSCHVHRIGHPNLAGWM